MAIKNTFTYSDWKAEVRRIEYADLSDELKARAKYVLENSPKWRDKSGRRIVLENMSYCPTENVWYGRGN